MPNTDLPAPSESAEGRPPRRLVIIGAVAAGTSVGAKARRNDEELEIVVYDRDRDISYSGCGIPYYVGGQVAEADELHPRNPAWFAKRYNMDIRTGHEVIAVDHPARTMRVRDLANGAEFTDTYDTLVLATGARSIIPPIPGVQAPGVFTVRNVQNAEAIRTWILTRGPKTAVVVGSGFIGLEMAEQLTESGIQVAMVERLPQVMPALDATEDSVTGVRLDNRDLLAADLVILSVGVRPDTILALQVGAELGPTGAIKVDRHMRTSVDGVYAVGDVAENFSLITGAPLWRPLGSTANKMGRIAGDVITGGTLAHRGILGTGIVRVFDLAVAHTGLTETEARAQGFEIDVIHNIKPAHATYVGGRELIIKAIAERGSGTAPLITPSDLDARRNRGEELQIIDVRSARDYAKSHVPGAVNIPLAELRARAGELHPNTPTVTYCNKGVSGNAGQTSCSDTASPACSTSPAATATTSPTSARACSQLGPRAKLETPVYGSDLTTHADQQAGEHFCPPRDARRLPPVHPGPHLRSCDMPNLRVRWTDPPSIR